MQKNGENFYGKIDLAKNWCPPEMKKLNFLWQIWHDPNSMYLPLEMKSWKSGKKILWQIWHDQNLMYPCTSPPPEGCGWDQDRTRTQMGQGWNMHVWQDDLGGCHLMVYYTTDSCAISPLASLLFLCFWLIWFINQRALCNHALCIVILCRH